MIRLLLVDDHVIVRAGLRMLFQAEDDMEIVGEASGGEEALAMVTRLQPDVIIMDVAMPGMNGIEATRRIRAVAPHAAILALTMHEDEQYFFAMLGAGASGYIPKRAAPDDLVSAVRVVSQGNVFLYTSLARFLMHDVMANHSAVETPEPLTAREQEVLALIAEGMTNREIGNALVISPKTVDRHRENIMTKLNLHNRVELVKYAIEKGIITLDGEE
ncbi:MAG: response regulator transcription factor [Caldilineaceae bacterium]|nr:response regulator transcription factor [Caldilineaceae bacterium]